MKIAEKIASLSDAVVSIAKNMPLLMGASAGFFTTNWGGGSFYRDARSGSWDSAFGQLLLAYTGLNRFGDDTKLEMGRANGLKGLFVGLGVREIISVLVG